jgi:threonine dehydrogenase-like Zn-dependent dehydrogenase
MKALTFDIHPAKWTLCKAAGWASKAAFWSPLSGLRLRDVPEPALPRSDWVRLRTRLGGICGTDLGAIFQRNHPASFLRVLTRFPVVLGHENVAEIDQVGPGVTGFSIGDRVCVEPTLSCEPRGITPPCTQCAAGQIALCENICAGDLPPGQIIGWNNFTGGSWAPHFVAHASQLHRVPDDVPDEIAVLVDPIACALHAAFRRLPADNETALVIGGGIIGAGLVASIRALASKARLIALVRHHGQANLMKRFGADDVVISPRSESSAVRYDRIAALFGGRRIPALFGNQAMIGGFDLVYDCVGSGASLTDAMKFTRGQGAVVALGTSQITVVDTTPLWFTELNLIGCNGRAVEQYKGKPLHTYDVVFDLIKNGRLDLTGLLTHQYPLDDYRDAFRELSMGRGGGLIKAAFVPSS